MKILLTAAMALAASSALSGEYVRPMPNKDTSAFYKWHEVRHKQPIISENKDVNILDAIEVFSAASEIEYVEDYVQHGNWYDKPNKNFDYWATPRETLKSGAGDCEDFAIVWYYKARELGFKAEQLAIVIGYLERERQLHAIFAIEVSGIEYVMDSYQNSLQRSEDYDTKNLKVTYRINENGWDRE